jgi:hypothetical protein
MAQLETSIFSTLTGASAVSAIVGTRVYPLVLPQKAALPAISYLRVSGAQELSLSGHSGLESPRIQIDCWATTYAQAKALSAAVQAAMLASSAFKVGSVSDRDLFEDETNVFRVSIDFSVWHRTA